MAITITRDLNVVSVGVPPVIHLSQYDSDFTLVFNLYASTGTFTMPAGTTAEIRGTKKDGNGYSADASVSGTVVTVTGDVQMTACAGANVFEIATFYNGEQLNTTNFVLEVERAALDAGTITSDTVLEELDAIIAGAATATQAALDADAAADRAEAAAQTLVIDDTLTQSGQAADAKATGDEITALKDDLGDIVDSITTVYGSDIDGWVTKKNVISNGTIGSSDTFSASSTFIRLPDYVDSVTYKTTTYSGFVGTYSAASEAAFLERLSVSANSSITLNTSTVKYIRISVSNTDITKASTLSWSWSYKLNSLANKAMTTDANFAEALSSGADLDNYKTPGNYKIGSNAIAQSLYHKPTQYVNAGRLFVIETSAANRCVQIIIANAANTPAFKRYYTGSVWSNWFQLANTADTVEASNVMVTSSNYTDYFPNGSFNDAIPNSIYGISTDVPLTDGPPGDAWIGTADRTSGYIRGTLMTFTQSNVPTGKYNGLVQMLVGYRNTDYKPTFSYRIATVSSNAYVWSNWCKFEENGYLHASNQIIYGGSFDKTIDDLNDAQPNCIYQIDLNCDGSDVAHTLGHHPCPGVSSVMMCYAFSYTTAHGRVQTLFNVRNEMYYRYGYLNATDDYRWTNWAKVSLLTGTYLENKGRLANNTDLNTITDNSIYLLGTNAGYGHDPLSGYTGFVTTKAVNDVIMQTAERLNGETHTRYSTDGGTNWSSWTT